MGFIIDEFPYSLDTNGFVIVKVVAFRHPNTHITSMHTTAEVIQICRDLRVPSSEIKRFVKSEPVYVREGFNRNGVGIEPIFPDTEPFIEAPNKEVLVKALLQYRYSLMSSRCGKPRWIKPKFDDKE